MKKILFTAKVDSHIIHFHIPFLKMFKEKGFEVHVASEGDQVIPYVDVKYNITFGVNPFSKNTINSYKTLKKIIETNKFDIIHTHTAIASVVTRLAAHKVKTEENNPRVIYTAHGFHFLKGGSTLNWLLYFPVEKIMGKFTDDLITINSDDYNLALKHKICKKIHYVNGVGVDVDAFSFPTRTYEDKKVYVLTYVAELNKNKNQELLIRSLALIDTSRFDYLLRVIGPGDQSYLKKVVSKLKIEDKVAFLGYREDIVELLKESDIAVSTSKREGLPVNLIESMASGLPIVATNCRGNNNLVVNDVNGFLVEYEIDMLEEAISKLLSSKDLRSKFGSESVRLSKQYGIDSISKVMYDLYFNERR